MGSNVMEETLTPPPVFPVSVKGILFWDSRVPLLLNERDEWELPGGRLEISGTSPEACVCRELKEELACVRYRSLEEIDRELSTSEHCYIHCSSYDDLNDPWRGSSVQVVR